MINAVIIDDELASIESIQILIKKSNVPINIIGSAQNITDGYKTIKRLKPDLLFLDIEMPDGSGFDLLDRFASKDFSVIFITAYNQYAIRAFKYSAIDYLLKPIDLSSFREAVARISERNEGKLDERLRLLKSNFHKDKPQRIAVSTNESIEIIDTDNITQFIADGSYTKVYTIDHKQFHISKPLREFDQLFSEFNFFRCHKSHLINLDHIRKVVKNENYIVMEDDTNAYISRRKKRELLDSIFDYLNQH